MRYASAVLALALAAGLRVALAPLVGEFYPFFTAAVAVAAWAGGVGPALLALVGGALVANYLFSPLHSPWLPDPWDWVGFALYIGSSLLIIAMVVSLRRHRRLAEERARKLAQASVNKDRFLATLGHELRNPLASIAYTLEALRLQSPDVEHVQRACRLAERQLHHLGRLVGELLDSSRIASGKLALHLEDACVQQIVETAVEASRPDIDARRHRLILHLPAAPLHLRADPVRLAQAVANLLANAARYTPPGGRIQVSAAPEPGGVRITVTDDGAGIAAGDLPRVFDMFAQGTSDATGQGLGIGLALVKGLVELHGGAVQAYSAGPGCGSTFTIRLPAQARGFPDTERPAPADALQPPALPAGDEPGTHRPERG